MSLVSVEAAPAEHLGLISAIQNARKARLAPPKATQADFDCSGPPFGAPHNLPAEIILRVAGFLDEVSLMALHHTNRDLFHIIPLTPDQASSACYARYLAEFANLCSKDHQGLCTTCQDLQPLASFSISEVMALERQQHARCLRHSQLWMCPHVSYDYNMIMGLGRTGRWIKIHNYTGFPNCGSRRCSHIFRHEFTPDQTSFLDDSIQSTITISKV